MANRWVSIDYLILIGRKKVKLHELRLSNNTLPLLLSDWDNPFCKYPCGKDSGGDVIEANKGDETPKCRLPNELLANPNDCER